MRTRREMKVLSLGLPRTGSASMAEALTILGYRDVHHGWQSIVRPGERQIIGRAVDASSPGPPTFTLEDWEELFGPCEAATDVASVFASQLIEVYPKAKVILAIRDFDKWSASIDEALLKTFFDFWSNLAVKLGSSSITVPQKLLLHLFDVRTVDEARDNMRKVYDGHHRLLREKLPAEQLLLYTMGEGWGPLCQFLGKPVPEMPFPRVNERAEMVARLKQLIRSELICRAKRVGPWIVLAGAVAAGIWRATSS